MGINVIAQHNEQHACPAQQYRDRHRRPAGIRAWVISQTRQQRIARVSNSLFATGPAPSQRSSFDGGPPAIVITDILIWPRQRQRPARPVD